MIITTIALIALAAGAVACLSLSSIKGWLRQRAANRYGKLIKKNLKNGNVEIIAIGLTSDDTETGQRTWKAKTLDSELAATFGRQQVVRITV
jgi:hypothetical protein